MRSALAALSLVATFCLMPESGAWAQGDWEFLGPSVGFQPTALCVTEHAVYLGMAESDPYRGLGLYRYRFVEGQWDLFAFADRRITGIAVWGSLDENMVVIRYDDTIHRSSVLRSTNGGESWTATLEQSSVVINGLVQAPSDPQHLIILEWIRYSSDGGQTWAFAECQDCCDQHHATFDPANADVAYLTAATCIESAVTDKSTDGGATWQTACYPCWRWGVAVRRSQTDHVMAAWGAVDVSTDAGASWFTRGAPFSTKVPYCPAWAPGSFFVLGRDASLQSYEVWQTWDLGESWVECGGGLPQIPDSASTFVSMFIGAHPTAQDLYVALEGSGLWRWTLAGESVPDSARSGGTGGSGSRSSLSVTPNPTAGAMIIRVNLPRASQGSLQLFDVCGRPVATVREGLLPQGAFAIDWRWAGTIDRPASGVYYLRLDAGARREEHRVILVR